MASNPKAAFFQQVWRHVAENVEKVKKKRAGDQTPEQWDQTAKKAKADLDKNKEARNVPLNLAHLSDPGAAAIPEDVLEMSKVKKSGRFYFWDKKENCPMVPKVWPRGRNVPITTLSKDIKKEGPLEHYGNCSIVAGFFWSMAEAKLNPLWQWKLPEFEHLMVNALADYALIQNKKEAEILAFNAVERNEEARENDGFTGVRKALLVGYAIKQVLKDKKGGKWLYEDVQKWLVDHIQFHDEKTIPGPDVCRHLHTVASDFLKNKRAFAAYQEADMEWGRSTFLDEYSKILILVSKSRGPDDLAFMAEFLVAEMKATSPAPAVPSNPSQTLMKEVGGPVCVAQASRDAIKMLLSTEVPPTWTPHSELLKELTSPTALRLLFPIGGQTPGSTVQRLAPCPSSLKHAINMVKAILEMETNWLRKLKGYLHGAKVWKVPDDKFRELFKDFDEWEQFEAARCEESGKEPPGKKKVEDSGGKQEENAGKTASGEEGKANEKKDRVAKQLDLVEQAKTKARGVYTNPGLVILKPERWDKAALEAVMKAQLFFADQGAFCAFFFADSDREAIVHPGQNKCLRYAPVAKARIQSFCEGLQSILKAGRDTVVIGIGRAKGNEEIVSEVVEAMGWTHEEIGAHNIRADFDNFIKSGSPKKKRRVHRGLGTVKYSQKFWVCWKRSPEGNDVKPRSGRRKYVDMGSPIAADCMLETPQVQLDEIYSVTAAEKEKALAGAGREAAGEGQAEEMEAEDPPPPSYTAAG